MGNCRRGSSPQCEVGLTPGFVAVEGLVPCSPEFGIAMTLADGRLYFLLLLALVSAGCQSEDTSPKPPYVSVADGRGALNATAPAASRVETIATASPQEKDDQYFIEFRSRYALSYGHSYVIFGRMNEAGEMVGPEVAGLHPKSKSAVPYVLGHFLPVPSETGWSDGDLEEQYRSASWRVMLNKAQYTKVVAYIRQMQESSPVWNASVYNCNAFAADIAKSMGYKTPAIWLRPQQFMTQLREMNTGPNAADNGARTVSAAG